MLLIFRACYSISTNKQVKEKMLLQEKVLDTPEQMKQLLSDASEDMVVFENSSEYVRFEIHTIRWGNIEDNDYHETYQWVLEKRDGSRVHGKSRLGHIRSFGQKSHAIRHFIDFLRDRHEKHIKGAKGIDKLHVR